MIHLLLSCFHFFTKTACKTILQCSNEMHTQAMTVLNLRTNYYSHYGIMLIKEHKCYNHNHNYLFSIPEIHQRGYRTCQYITTNTVQNESLQYNTYNNNNNSL